MPSLLSRIASIAVLLSPTATGIRAPDGPVVAARGAANLPARQPQVAVDPSGRVFLAFGVGDSIRCATSTDDETAFGAATTVGSPGVLALGMRRGPRIVATRDSVVIAAIGGPEGKGKDGDLLIWRSTDGGSSWSVPRRLNGPEGSAREGLHALAAGPNGELFCAWNDNRDGTMAVFGSRSADGGATWEPDAPVYRSPEKGICPCCHPSVAFGADGLLYVMWRNALGGDRDLFLTRSDDGGKSFSKAEKQGQGTWKIEACPMDGGAIVPGVGGRVETVWMREFAVYRSRPGEAEAKLGEGTQGWAAPGPGGVFAAWLQGRPGKLLAIRPGQAEPTLLAERANDPVVAGAIDGRGPVVAAWESPADGTIATLVLAPRR